MIVKIHVGFVCWGKRFCQKSTAHTLPIPISQKTSSDFHHWKFRQSLAINIVTLALTNTADNDQEELAKLAFVKLYLIILNAFFFAIIASIIIIIIIMTIIMNCWY